MPHTHNPDGERKTYYVSVGARQALEDKEAASFEFAIVANEEELNKLQQLFERTGEPEEGADFVFSRWPTVSDGPNNSEYESDLQEIYRMLHRLGTDETKRHIEAMNILH